MQIEIQGRSIKSNNYPIGTQGENNVETITFVMPKLFNGLDLSAPGTQAILCALTSQKTEVMKSLDIVVVGENLHINWQIGREETQDIGLLYVAIHFNTALDSLLKTEMALFKVSSTINIDSPQPVLFHSRMSAFAVEPDIDIITISNKKMIIPASVQALAVSGDNENRKVKIKMPRYAGGEDLLQYSFALQANTTGGSVSVPLNFSDEDGDIVAIWTVERPLTDYAGKVELQLKIGNITTDSFYDQTEIATVNVLPTLAYDPIVPVTPSEFQIYLVQIEALRDETQGYKEQAHGFSESAGLSATQAKSSENNALASASMANEARKHQPYIGANSNWYIFDTETGAYKDTSVSSKGNMQFATFEVDASLELLMHTTEEYNGADFRLNENGELEVNI